MRPKSATCTELFWKETRTQNSESTAPTKIFWTMLSGRSWLTRWSCWFRCSPFRIRRTRETWSWTSKTAFKCSKLAAKTHLNSFKIAPFKRLWLWRSTKVSGSATTNNLRFQTVQLCLALTRLGSASRNKRTRNIGINLSSSSRKTSSNAQEESKLKYSRFLGSSLT